MKALCFNISRMLCYPNINVRAFLSRISISVHIKHIRDFYRKLMGLHVRRSERTGYSCCVQPAIPPVSNAPLYCCVVSECDCHRSAREGILLPVGCSPRMSCDKDRGGTQWKQRGTGSQQRRVGFSRPNCSAWTSSNRAFHLDIPLSPYQIVTYTPYCRSSAIYTFFMSWHARAYENTTSWKYRLLGHPRCATREGKYDFIRFG